MAISPWSNIGTEELIPVTNMLERLNQELKRRTHVVRIFPNAAACLRLVRALAVEAHENCWRPSATSTWPTWPSTRRKGSA
jgi:transposase-like protein